MIPSFAVGRTQEMLYFIRKIKEDHLVKNHDGFQVFVDSPLALEATTIFQKHMWDDYDEEAMELVKKASTPLVLTAFGPLSPAMIPKISTLIRIRK